MHEFFGFIAIMFYKLFYMSITATAIGVAALLFRGISYKKIAPYWQCVIWAFVIIALLVPFRPESNISLAGAIEPFQDTSFRDDYEQSQQQYQSLLDSQYEVFKTTQTGAEHNALFYRHILIDIIIPLVWLIGVFVILMFMFVSWARLKKRLMKHQTERDTQRIRGLLAGCKEQMSISKDFEVIVQDYIKSPALFGIFAPMIVLPSYIDEMNDQSVQYILLHELGHYKRFDILSNYLMLLIQAVYWFNPLIWVLFKFARQDIEHANDAYALKAIGDKQAKGYNYTLVEILGRAGGIPFFPKYLCMVNNKNDMARRIQIIKCMQIFKKNRLFAAITSVVLIFALSLLFLTSPSAAAIGDATDDRLVGNWIWNDLNGYTGMYTFYADGTVSYVMRDNDIAQAILSGEYTSNQQDDTLQLFFNKSGGSDLFIEPYFIENTVSYSFSSDGQNLFLANDKDSWSLIKTNKPSMLQISSGLWEGLLADGSRVSILFGLDNMVSVRIEKDNALTDFYGGFYWLYDGWMQMDLMQDSKAWDRYIEGTEKNREIMKKSANTGVQDEIPVIPYLPPLEITHHQDIILSTAGDKLLLPDFMGGAGDVLELVRQD